MMGEFCSQKWIPNELSCSVLGEGGLFKCIGAIHCLDLLSWNIGLSMKSFALCIRGWRNIMKDKSGEETVDTPERELRKLTRLGRELG